MLTPEGMEQLVTALMAQGHSRNTAEEFATQIGDTPEMDADGLWVIRDDHGQIIGKIKPIENE